MVHVRLERRGKRALRDARTSLKSRPRASTQRPGAQPASRAAAAAAAAHALTRARTRCASGTRRVQRQVGSSEVACWQSSPSCSSEPWPCIVCSCRPRCSGMLSGSRPVASRPTCPSPYHLPVHIFTIPPAALVSRPCLLVAPPAAQQDAPLMQTQTATFSSVPSCLASSSGEMGSSFGGCVGAVVGCIIFG
jgi:hypothetical protein